ncbi:unnamed protein product [Callosobruchus maculatus]|uniref:Uncharacterized protein n=1 Tax=Callosobruchus maculatus TaxID=64391 RepID=A0A653DDM0_CALMS|nr:unnamed protein product [Callosobruchus maculatus]
MDNGHVNNGFGLIECHVASGFESNANGLSCPISHGDVSQHDDNRYSRMSSRQKRIKQHIKPGCHWNVKQIMTLA